MSPGQESPVLEEQELHRPSRGKGAPGRWSRTQEGGDALGLPGTLTDTCALGECAELPKGCSAHGGTRRDPVQLKGLGGGSAEGAAGRERESNSVGAGAQLRQDTAQDPASPATGRGREGPGQQGRSCPS